MSAPNSYAWKIAASIILALAVVFILQKMRFRFVTTASAGIGA